MIKCQTTRVSTQLKPLYSFTVFTADQQLYRVALDILWTFETRFTNFVLMIGGMQWVKNFVGCIGVLMRNSG